VGKSSLLNRLFGRKNLAKTSSTPGKTRTLNFYRVNGAFYLVDLPGYGYARVSKKEVQRVKSLMSDFFRTVKQARLVVLLIDSRRGFMDSDLEILSQILDKKIKLLTVLTKSDKLRHSELNSQKKFFKINLVYMSCHLR
jgi:GTP-binding protein